MKIEKRGNSYRVQPTINGKRISITFDYKPTQKDIADAISKMTADYDKKDSFGWYANQYIENRSNVLSPSSVLSYNKLIKALTPQFRATPLREITQDNVQAEINAYALNHAPKTVRSLHGFISSVLTVYRPSLTLRTTLPQKEIKARYLPSESDIQAILDASQGSEYHVAFQLGVLSLRRSEVSALTIEDIDGNYITISKNMVYNNRWLIKPAPKTDASYRTIYIPDSLKEEILSQGYVFKFTPPKLNEALHRYQDILHIPRFRFHDLRHYFASYASANGIPEADIMAIGGWKSDFVFKQVYRESMDESRRKSAVAISETLFAPKSAPKA